MLFELLPEYWQESLQNTHDLLLKIEKELNRQNFIPEQDKIFRALDLRPSEYKVLILGQDPYPNPEHAMGLAFSVPTSVEKLPASLKNIFKELADDCKSPLKANGDLSPWADQGVMLLNRTLTVTPGESNSHLNIGWRDFTQEVVKVIEPYIGAAILWGNNAGELAPLITPSKIIAGVHPSPLSAYRGFFGSKPFSRANSKLSEAGLTEISW